jgi:hypothetical protein
LAVRESRLQLRDKMRMKCPCFVRILYRSCTTLRSLLAAKEHDLMDQSCSAYTPWQRSTLYTKDRSTGTLRQTWLQTGAIAFERYVDRGYHELRRQAMYEEGILCLTLRQRQLSMAICHSYLSTFSKRQGADGGAWRSNQFLSPFFDSFIHNIKQDVLTTASMNRNIFPAQLKRPNLNSAEYAALRCVLSLAVWYNNHHDADKDYGPIIYSRELAKEKY